MTCPSCHEEKCQGAPICGLKYIARSPKSEHGGFHENAIQTAKDALAHIEYLEVRVRALQSQQLSADHYFIHCALERVRLSELVEELRRQKVEVVSA